MKKQRTLCPPWGKAETTQQVPEQTLQFSCQATPSSSKIPVPGAITPLVQRGWKTKPKLRHLDLLSEGKEKQSLSPSQGLAEHKQKSHYEIGDAKHEVSSSHKQGSAGLQGLMSQNPLWKGEELPKQPSGGPSSSPADQAILINFKISFYP